MYEYIDCHSNTVFFFSWRHHYTQLRATAKLPPTGIYVCMYIHRTAYVDTCIDSHSNTGSFFGRGRHHYTQLRETAKLFSSGIYVHTYITTYMHIDSH